MRKDFLTSCTALRIFGTLFFVPAVSYAARLRSIRSKRKLMREELAFLEKFEEELAEAKDVIAKEIRDIAHS